jgi:hypothetical protein
MLLTRLILVFIILLTPFSAIICQAAALSIDLKQTLQVSNGFTDISIIVHFDNKLNPPALRKAVNLAIQSKRLNRYNFRKLYRKNTLPSAQTIT